MANENGKKKGKTRYTVLRQIETNPETFVVVDEVEESSSSRATRRVAEKRDEAGTYLAVPARSFAPEPLKLERTPRAVPAK